LSEKEILALSLGQTFIPTPKVMKDFSVYIDKQFDDYHRRCSIARYFNEHPSSSEIDPKLRVKGSTWIPPLSSGDIMYRYLNQVEAKLDRSVRKLEQSFAEHYDHMEKTPNWIYSTLRDLKSNTDIIITDADKNMGICVISTEQYVKEGLRQLNDPSTYRELSEPPNFGDIRVELESILKRHNSFFAPKKYPKESPRLSDLAKLFFQDLGCSHNNPNPTPSSRLRLGHFYMLMKVHKEKVTGRPIVSSFDTCSYHVSRYIDAVLQPLLKRSFSYVQSSEHLIHLLEKSPVRVADRDESVMLCADIESLYPNIPLDIGMEFFKRSIIFNNNKLKTNKLSRAEIDLICDLTKWVLHNNYFTFGDKIYHQINGTAMGTPCAVVFACLFIDELERGIMQRHKFTPFLYRRYIDDIFAIFAKKAQAEEFISKFNGVCTTIRCADSSTTISTEKGVFLDVEVFRPSSFTTDGFLHTRLFQKKQNKYLYIPPFSYHSKSMFPAFITAEINRYRLLCTDDQDFLTACQQFKGRLQDRGYSLSFLNPLFLSLPTRQSLLDKVHARFSQLSVAEKSQKPVPAPFVFKVIGTPQTKMLKLANCLTPSDGIERHPALEPFFKKKPIVSYSNAPSISTYFSRARKSLHGYLKHCHSM
jgi:hypothetical protein